MEKDGKEGSGLFSANTYKNHRFFLIILVVYVSLIVDIGLSKITDLIPGDIASSVGIMTFIVITLISSFGQFYLYSKTRSILKSSKFKPPYAKSIDLIAGVLNYSLIAINVLIVFQLLLFSAYNVFLLLLINTISYGLAAFLMGVLSKRFFIWFYIKRSLIVLIYGLAVAAISFNAITNVIYFDAVLVHKTTDYKSTSAGLTDTIISPYTTDAIRNSYDEYDLPYGLGNSFFDAQFHSVEVYFILSWIGTAMLLLHYIKRIGRVKYWSLMSLALVYFLSYYLNNYGPEYIPSNDLEAIRYYLFNTFAISIGGILFGIGFWLISRTINIKNQIKNFTVIVGCSFLLLFNVIEATVSQTSYPPFGVANVSFVGLSAYLLLFGLSYSAISISKDVELRKQIRKMVIERSNLLGDIGDAQVEDEVMDKVTYLEKNKKEIFADSSVGSSLSTDEIRQYIDEVISEIKMIDPSNQKEDDHSTK